MATEISVTDGVVRVTANGQVQPLYQAIDVSKYDQADLILQIFGSEGASPSATVSIIGAMSADTEDGWVILGSFTGAGAVNFAEKKNFPQLPKYIRWKITAFNGTAVSFSIRGMLRNN